MNYAYVLLGTNIGEKNTNLKTACNKINSSCGSLLSFSSIYNTSPWGITDQPDFLNMVVKLETKYAAPELLELLLGIEKEMGRSRDKKWGERIIDLDILYFNQEIIVKENLKIPHPHLHERCFTLIPLSEIAEDFIHPVFNVSTKKLLERCEDKGEVTKTSERLIL
jgi:2-amino-4-hydroxy-6-hydroxymethyldihydropteridine diphosphokinase